MEKQRTPGAGLRLLKSGRLGFFRIVFSRTGFLFLMLVLQLALVFFVFYLFERFVPHLFALQFIFVAVMVLYLINTRQDASAKITWLVFIMIAPVFGTLFLLFTRTDIGHRKLRDRLRETLRETDGLLDANEELIRQLSDSDPDTASLCRYFARTGACPPYTGTAARYFSQGEAMFERLLLELESAERFIFLEFFIVEEGQMWGQILEVLARKAAQGVEVRVLYDGSNEFFTLPRSYPEKLKALGINCKAFAPLRPFLSTHYNYRDHRKILVIDGRTAFTGGVNLSDRYINAERVYGHWKDTGLMLQGAAVGSFTRMFLQLWSIDAREENLEKYLTVSQAEPENASGVVIPYDDCPLDEYRVGEMVYIDILNRARSYVHIMSPYLILDGETEMALRYAAERGVEVSIILPGIPDKKAPYALAKTHYAALLDAGVKIYEYTPGFIHAKVFCSDDRKAVVGSINLDYRSLYHHFECAAYLVDVPCIEEIEADFQSTLGLCRQVTREDVRKEKFHVRLGGMLYKAIASLL